MSDIIIEKNDWHTRSINHVISSLNTNIDKGLSNNEIDSRIKQFGVNLLPEPQKESAFIKFMKHFHDMLIYILIAAALINALTGHYTDTAVILLVVVINAMIGFIQESKAENALAGIRAILALKAKVLREGTRQEIDAKNLTIGDIVFLKPGDKVPADMRLARADALKIEEAMLTGEAVSSEKNVAPLEAGAMLGDRRNMAFSGTTVSAGTATGIVTAIGAATEVGKINQMLAEVEPLATPLLRKIADFSKAIAALILIPCAAVFLFGWQVQQHPPTELLLSVIAMAVAAIPEGLPAIMSIILAIGVQSMAKRKAIVRNLPAVETLGSVSVICSDKTGTLTKNEMTVETLQTRNKLFSVSGAGYAPAGEIRHNDMPVNIAAEHDVEKLLTCFHVCNEATLNQNAKGQWEVVGEPTEGALAVLWEKSGLPDPENKKINGIPFDSQYKYMAVLVEGSDENAIYIKGAPEQLIAMAFQDTENATAIQEKDFWTNQVRRLAQKGMRTIAGAWKKVEKSKQTLNHDDLLSGVVLIGVAGIIDPPREEAGVAVAQCAQAGIQVKMITGDHVETAKSIGAQLGIGDGVFALEGKDMDALNDAELAQVVCACHVFARTSPEHKLRLVRALQAKGVVCAMTGDGINDAPALRRANIGIAMGIKGTEVTKEAAAIVLADDNFHTIAAAVEEGRKVYDNLLKTLLFILPTNLAEGILIMVNILMGSMLILTPVQVLWVNMVTSVTISFAFAFEPVEEDAMQRPPRSPKEPLLPKYFIFRIIYVGVLLAGACLLLADFITDVGSLSPETLRTMILQTIVLCECVYMFNTRSIFRPALRKGFFSNKAAFIVVAILVILQIIVGYVPTMNTILGTAPMSLQQWLMPAATGATLFVVVEIEKAIARKFFDKPASTHGEEGFC